jgi:hypothetical protein
MSASQRGVPTETLRATSTPGQVGGGLARLAFDGGAASDLLSTGTELWCCSAQRPGLLGLDRAAISSHSARRTGRRPSVLRGRRARPLSEKLLEPRLRSRRLDLHPLIVLVVVALGRPLDGIVGSNLGGPRVLDRPQCRRRSPIRRSRRVDRRLRRTGRATPALSTVTTGARPVRSGGAASRRDGR